MAIDIELNNLPFHEMQLICEVVHYIANSASSKLI